MPQGALDVTGPERHVLDGRPVDADAFWRAAIDPSRSVVVDACAGSGKTTLLVARIVRALLDGAEPDQVLAVTFTRLAAHEMRERLVTALRTLALDDDATLHDRLAGWYGLGDAGARACAPRARSLYEALLRHPRGPEITTFHRWFRLLALMAPMSDEAGEGTELTEEGAALLQQAWFGWLEALAAPGRAALRADFEALVGAIGLTGARRCLESLVAQRADWAVAAGVDLDAPLDALLQGADRMAIAYRDLWREAACAFVAAPDGSPPIDDGATFVLAVAGDGAIRDAIGRLAPVLGRGSDEARRLANTLESLAARTPADAAEAAAWLDALHAATHTTAGSIRSWRSSKALTASIEAAGGTGLVHGWWEALCARIAAARDLRDEWPDVGLNGAAMRCGVSLLGALRQVKRAQGVIDFADLESIAWRMLRDPGTAAYVQCRMDRRYRHLLFDEFQDTSSLQWRVIADWLQSYAGAGERPSVFVVGDPKQSIYRFRRAEARVFDAAKALLRQAFDAREAGTDTTRRNATEIVEVLNARLPAVMPHYRPQATLETRPGLFWRLALVEPLPGADDDGTPVDDPDWLAGASPDEASLRHREGLAIADAIVQAREALARQGGAVRWSEVFVLARSRTGFEAYERALRERGLPVQSDRVGGLLRTLEGDDLRALLSFVRRPADDLALAQVLASPLIGLAPSALAWIAAQAPSADGAADAESLPRRWWPRLRRLAQAPAAAADPPPFDLPALVELLAGWIDHASRVPAHDFLDAVLARVDAFARYPAVLAPAQREVAHANLCAMLGLALDVDAGRFPSLARFLRRLRGFDTLEDREGPSEGRGDAVDAIRLMTIHAAKGLEADLVVLADAHQRPQPDGQRLHVDWSPEQPAPAQVSFVLQGSRPGRARRDSFAREQDLREREDRNLLYVALTRARRGVVVSGTRSRNAPRTSWYTALDGVGPPPASAADACPAAAAVPPATDAPGVFEMRLLDLPRLDVGTLRDPGETSGERDADGAPAGLLATELGHALHRALELLPAGLHEAEVLAALHAYALDDAQRRLALARARSVLALAPLAAAFDPARPAASEFEILDADGNARRIDRLARVDDETWILDYKWSVDALRRPAYCEQLGAYRALVDAMSPPPLGPARRLRTVLVDATAGRVEFDVDLPVAPADATIEGSAPSG